MEDFMFNLEDMNLSQESGNIFNQEELVDNTETAESAEENNKEVTVATEEKSSEAADISETNTETKETTSKAAPSEQDDSSQSSTLYSLAKYLKDEGALYLDDLEKVETLEDLKALIQKSNDQAKYSNLNETQRRYQDSLEAGIPKNEYEDLEKEIQTFQNIKVEDISSNEQLRFELNALDLMEKGLTQEKAIKLAKLSVNDESSVADTKDILKNLIENKKIKFKEILDKSNTTKEVTLKDIKESIYSKEKLLDMPLNEITKNKLFDLMTTKIDSDERGLPMNEVQKWQKDNPIEANMFMNYMYMMTNKGKDLGLIKTNSTSNAAKELEKKLKSMNFDDNGSLIIPDSYITDKKTFTNNGKNDLTINI